LGPSRIVTLFLEKTANTVFMARKKYEKPSNKATVDSAMDWFGAGIDCEERGHYADALKAYEKALSINPRFPEALYNCALLLKNKSGAVAAAQDYYRRALDVKPNFPDALNNLGVLLQNSGRFEESAALFRKALKLEPDFVSALSNLGMILYYLGYFEESISFFEKALSLRPRHAEVLNNLGSALSAAGKLTDAITVFRRSIAINGDCAAVHCSLASALLGLGRFEEGWREYQWRWQMPSFACVRRNTAKPQWRGEPGKKRILLLWSEQGLGDTIQFCRYAPLAVNRGWRVILSVQPALVSLLRSLSGIEHVVMQGPQPLRFDMHCPLMDLPAIFNTRLETVPADVPYLAADEQRIEFWRNRLPCNNDQHLKVGLTWSGGRRLSSPALIAADKRRSIPPALFAPMTKVPRVQFYSLQKDGPAAPAELGLIDLMADCGDFADTAALVANLDLVISVDTAVVHLAGALNKPIWVLSRFDGCWRWLRARDDSPWYPTLRLFSQERPGDWESVIARVVEQLREVLAHPDKKLSGPWFPTHRRVINISETFLKRQPSNKVFKINKRKLRN